MQSGKLPPDILNRLLARTTKDPGVIIGPAYGEDAAAVRFGGRILVAAGDPVTFATDRIGHYAVSVNANDIAVMGARPRYFLATILLPEDAPESDAEAVFDQINDACRAIGVTLIGGHTEITPSVADVVVSGCMLGEAAEDSLITSAGARVGDAVILAGGIAVEGTTILAREAADELAERGVTAEVISRAQSYLDDPGICIAHYAKVATQTGGVTSMHDPTEGGLATGLRELAAASGHGIEIVRDSIHILPECAAICDALDLDPLGLIASGSLLITAPPDAAERIVRALGEDSAPVCIMGTVVNADAGMKFDDGTAIPEFDRDEIARHFARATNQEES